MGELLINIEELIKKVKESSYIYTNKVKYLNNLNFSINNIINFKFGDLIEFISNIIYSDCDDKRIETIKNILNDYDLTNDFSLFLQDLKNIDFNINLENNFSDELNKIKLPDNSKKILRNIFGNCNSENVKIFLSFFNSDYKKVLSVFLEEIIGVKNGYNLAEEIKINTKIKQNQMEIFLNKTLCLTSKLLKMAVQEKKRLNNDNKQYEKNKNQSLIILEEIKDLILSEKYIDYSKYKNYLNENLTLNIILYNNNIMEKSMKEEMIKKQKLSLSNVDNIDYFIKINGFNIVYNKINNKNIFDTLKFINDKLPFLKEYSNIMYYLLDYSSLESLKFINFLIDTKIINNKFTLDNYDIIFNDYTFNNFKKNIALLSNVSLNIKSIINYNVNILFIDNDLLNDRIEKYKKYNINFDNSSKNFEFLLQDNSHIIDMFIEIGLYDFIKENISFINNSSINVIKRILLFKKLGYDYLNKEGKIKGMLTDENKFIINNNELNDVILFDYKNFIDNNIINNFNGQCFSEKLYNVDELEPYLIDNMEYKFGNMIISKNKVLRNMNMLYNSELINTISRKEIIFYSIIYNYPEELSNNDINNLYNVIDIKRKLKEI